MPAARKDERRTVYVVVNPREIPEGIPIIVIDRDGDTPGREYFAGDEYDGPNLEQFREEGLVMTERQAERAEHEAEEEAEAENQEDRETADEAEEGERA